MGKNTEHLRQLDRPPIRLKDPPGYICLNHNEAPFSGAASLRVTLDHLNAYPEPFFLYEQLARHHGVEPGQLLLTCGSEQGLRHVFDTFLDDGDQVVLPSPTFGMLQVFCHYRRATVVRVGYDASRRLDLDAFLGAMDEATRLVYLANPDSPTGGAIELPQIERIAAHCAALPEAVFLLDEAYHDYYPLPTVELIPRFPGLVITRSFSKGWGLAGIRAGYLISNPAKIELLRKQKPMDELSSPTIELCSQALERPDLVQRNVAQVQKWRDRFREVCWPTLTYLPTEGNFIMLRSTRLEHHLSAFEKHRVRPRTFGEGCLQDCLRFSVGPDEIMERIFRFLNASEFENGATV